MHRDGDDRMCAVSVNTCLSHYIYICGQAVRSPGRPTPPSRGHCSTAAAAAAAAVTSGPTGQQGPRRTRLHSSHVVTGVTEPNKRVPDTTRDVTPKHKPAREQGVCVPIISVGANRTELHAEQHAITRIRGWRRLPGRVVLSDGSSPL